MDCISFIRAQLGRMSDAQIRRSLGLQRESDYRELKALAMVDRRRIVVPDPVRGADRINRRPAPPPGPRPERVVELLLEAAGLPLEALRQPQDASSLAARDVLVWLLRSRCRQAHARIARLLDVSEYAVTQIAQRHCAAIALEVETQQQRQWREAVAARLDGELR
jgi:hypothetical protein